jgi:hypothetical protein
LFSHFDPGSAAKHLRASFKVSIFLTSSRRGKISGAAPGVVSGEPYMTPIFPQLIDKMATVLISSGAV